MEGLKETFLGSTGFFRGHFFGKGRDEYTEKVIPRELYPVFVDVGAGAARCIEREVIHATVELQEGGNARIVESLRGILHKLEIE